MGHTTSKIKWCLGLPFLHFVPQAPKAARHGEKSVREEDMRREPFFGTRDGTGTGLASLCLHASRTSSVQLGRSRQVL